MGINKRLTRTYSFGRPHMSSMSGMSLIELLAAMIVLLVGVYAVAALFPKLARNIIGEKDRTIMGRAVDELADQVQSGLGQLIGAVTPEDGNINVIDIGSSRPDDPDDPATPVNSRDDYVWVRGEWFDVPSPQLETDVSHFGPDRCLYMPRLGLIDSSPGSVIVTERRELKPAPQDPGVGGTLPAGYYYIRDRKTNTANTDADLGEIIATPPAGFSAALMAVDYDWSDDTGFIRHMTQETLPVGTNPSYLQVGPPGTGRERIGWPRMGNSRVFVFNIVDVQVEPFGAAINLSWEMAGKRLRMDYRLKTDSNRYVPIMHEDVMLPVTQPWKMKLTFSGLDADEPLADTDAFGNTIPDVFLIVVNTQDGRIWTKDSTPSPLANWVNKSPTDPRPNDVNIILDMKRGEVTLTGASLMLCQNAPLRIFYRTTRQHAVQVQKAPRDFVERDPLIIPRTPDWVHRSFEISDWPIGSSGEFKVLHHFPAYCEDQSVQVDYLYIDDPALPPKLVTGELHVIQDLESLSATNLGYGFTLNKPDVAGILKVNGASAKVCGWWRQDDGRVDMVDLTTMLFGDS